MSISFALCSEDSSLVVGLNAKAFIDQLLLGIKIQKKEVPLFSYVEWFGLETGLDDVAGRLSLSAFMHCIAVVTSPLNMLDPK